MLPLPPHGVCLGISRVNKIQQVLGEGFGAGNAAHLSCCHPTRAWVQGPVFWSAQSHQCWGSAEEKAQLWGEP